MLHSMCIDRIYKFLTQLLLFFYLTRYLSNLKGFVRNRAHPEGSIAEGYVINEMLTFLSMYLPGTETKFSRPERNCDNERDDVSERLSLFSMSTRPMGKAKVKPALSQKELDDAHWYILSNCEEVEPYLKYEASTFEH